MTLAGLLSSCSNEHGDSPLSRRTVIRNQPIATWVYGKYVDENSPLDYYVKFRNIGPDIVSFDYTIADRADVPHLDRNGPNSGLVPNLYPGVEVAVPNTLKRSNVIVSVGKVIHGKKTLEQLQAVYPSDATSRLADAAPEPIRN